MSWLLTCAMASICGHTPRRRSQHGTRPHMRPHSIRVTRPFLGQADRSVQQSIGDPGGLGFRNLRCPRRHRCRVAPANDHARYGLRRLTRQRLRGEGWAHATGEPHPMAGAAILQDEATQFSLSKEVRRAPGQRWRWRCHRPGAGEYDDRRTGDRRDSQGEADEVPRWGAFGVFYQAQCFVRLNRRKAVSVARNHRTGIRSASSTGASFSISSSAARSRFVSGNSRLSINAA